MYKIVKKETLNSVVELMEIHAPFVARKCEPGQFIILRVDEDGERVPLTIADYDREKETEQKLTLSLVVRAKSMFYGLISSVNSARTYM